MGEVSQQEAMMTELDLNDRVAIVTGASRGIGRAVAIELASHGATLALCARTERDLLETAAACRDLGAHAEALPVDLTQMSEIPGLVERVVARLGRLDVLVNNAGMMAGGDPASADLDAWDRALDLNLRAVIHLTHAALPHIREAARQADGDEPEGVGTGVVNIASIAGLRSIAGASMYCATKHGVVGFSGSLFDDVRSAGIKVSAICPGYVATDMPPEDGLDATRMIQPEDIAATVSFVLGFPSTGCPTQIVVRPQRSPYDGG